MIFSCFTRSVIEELTLSASRSTINNYESTLQSVLSYQGGDVSLKRLYTHAWLCDYQKFLVSRGLQRNTVAFYMRVLRAIYNKALKRGLLSYTDALFDSVVTTEEATVKRSLSQGKVRRLMLLELSAAPHLEFSRDMFLLSIYLQGMPYVDLANLRKTDVKGSSILQYRRQKTGTEITVGIDKRAYTLLRKYMGHDPSSPYLLPILKSTGTPVELKKQYDSSLRNYNRHLKKIAALAGIEENLSSYVCRHTWATIAHHSGVDIHIISQALGHKKEETTHIYVRMLSPAFFVKANKQVIDAVWGYGKAGKRKRKEYPEDPLRGG